MPDFKTSQIASNMISARLGAPYASRAAAERVHAWPLAGDRPELLDFKPEPGKPGVPGIPGEGADGYRALLDLIDQIPAAMAEINPADAPVTVAMIDQLEAALYDKAQKAQAAEAERRGFEPPAEEGGPCWLCEPDMAAYDWRRAIIEA